MTVTWTEMFQTMTPSGTGWITKDAYTDWSVPKGSVLLMVALHNATTAARNVGFRYYGSSLERYGSMPMHEAESGGYVTMSMFVQTDASGGRFQYKWENSGSVIFYCLGYFTGTNFTERYDLVSSPTASAWTNWDMYGSYSVPKGRVCQIAMCNRQDAAATTMGVRMDGSSLARTLDVHEAESASVETTDMEIQTWCAKTDTTNGYLEYYTSNATSTFVHLGYFDSEMDYQELLQKITVSSASWQEQDLTSYLDADGRTVEVFCGHAATGTEQNCGLRKTSDESTNRYFLVHEAETNGVCGETFITRTDSSGKVDSFCDASYTPTDYTKMYLVGYFKFTEPSPVGRSYGTVIC